MTRRLLGREWRRAYPLPGRLDAVRYWGVALEWKPADLWIGAFWRRARREDFDLWVCLLPCLPIHVYWYWWR